MSYNGSGTFNINTAGQPVVTGTVITSTAFNALTADLASGLTTALTKDGQTTPTANIPMGTFKITGLGAGTAATDAAQFGQLQAGATQIATVTGTDTFVGTLSPALGAYGTGNLFSFVAPNTNTGASTINLNSLGAKSITKLGSTALAAGDIVSGRIYLIEYDGTRFQLINPSASSVSSFSAGTTGFTPSTATTGAVTLAGTLATTNGGTGLTSFTANGVVYASSTSALATGSALVFDGTNLGLGVTPSAWGSGNYKGFQVGGSASIMGRAAGSDAYFMSNTYFDQTNYRYTTSRAAASYSQDAGSHQWFNAASGTAGNAITFTQAMTLDASGRLLVGTTSSIGTAIVAKLQASGSQSFITTNNEVAGFVGVNSNADNSLAIGADPDNLRSNSSIVLYVDGISEKARIDSSGNLLVGSSTQRFTERLRVIGATVGAVIESASGYVTQYLRNDGASGTRTFVSFLNSGSTQCGSITYDGTVVLFNTTSDYRLKTVIGAVSDAGNRIDALKPISYQWTESGQQARGFLAHEFQEVYASSVSGTKDAVDAKGKPVYQAMQASTSEVIADLVSEIQSLRKRLATAGI